MLTKEDIKVKLPIVDYISRTIPLHRQGKAFMGLCPLHPDSQTKSLAVYEDGGWKCFGCGKSGDVITWVMETQKLDFKDAQAFLRRELGDAPKTQQKVLDIELARRFHDTMPPEKREYYHKRGITDSFIDQFMLGYSGEAYTIPIIDDQDVLRGIKYRRDDSLESNKGKPKYWNIEGTTVRLFNANVIPNNEDVIYCEGEFDCILLSQMGYAACTGTGGVAKFDREWIPLFAQCKRVYICLDNDAAGLEWAPKIRHMIGSQAVIVTLPEGQGKDVTDYLLKNKFEGFDKLLRDASATQERAERIAHEGLVGELNLNGFLRSYVDYASTLTDAPREYHLAVGLSIVAAVVGNKVFLKLWGQEIYPHLWHVLISPSGFYRKTTAMRIGLDVLGLGAPDAILMDDYTPETMKKNLAAKPSGIMKAWEFGDLLERMDRDYMRGTKEFLTTIYDVGYSRATEKDGTINIQKPALTFLSGSTIDWLQSKVKVGDMRGGFLARFLFLPAYKKSDWKGAVNRHDEAWQNELASKLKEIRTINGEVDLSLVLGSLNTWLRGHERDVDAEKLPKELMGFYSRSATYVAKLSVLFQMSEDKSLKITEANLERAIIYLEYLYQQLSLLVADGLGVNTRASRRMRDVKEILGRYEDGLPVGELYTKMHILAQELDPVLKTLMATGDIIMERKKQKGPGRPSVIYRLTDTRNKLA